MSIPTDLITIVDSAIADLECYRTEHPTPNAADRLATIVAALHCVRGGLFELIRDVHALSTRLGETSHRRGPTPFPKGPTPP